MKKSDKLVANWKRNKTIRYLKNENIMLADKLEKYVKNNCLTLSDYELEMSAKFIKNLRYCSNATLYEQTYKNIKIMASLSCSKKLCNVCNWLRQKKIRRKYNAWFSINQTISKVSKNKKIEYITHSNISKYKEKGYKLRNENVKYDLKHLTLTVPHSEDGWLGEKFYFKKIIAKFNQMRKTPEWKKRVFGGEYGVEVTRGNQNYYDDMSDTDNNGYHIHIHALLFTKKETQNRNLLHLDIFRIWNRLTVDDNYWREEFTEEHKEAIKKGNKDYITDKYIKKLNPKGATFINLSSIYHYEKNKKTGKWEKKYITEIGTEATQRAVMETISYHFKPKLFCSDVKDFWGQKSYDLEAIVEISAKLHRGNKMYHKFGCLEKEKCLNIKDDTLLEDYDETAEDVDEDTGEVLQTHYFITNPLNTYPKGAENEIFIKRRADIQNLNVQSGREAVKKLIDYSIKNR